MQKIKRGDQVQVLSGKDKGRQGAVTQVIRGNKYVKLIVEGVNMVKKHVRGNPQQQKPGGIIEKEAPLHACKVAIVNPATGKPDRVGFKNLADGKKVRFFKSNGEVVDV